MTRYFCTYFDRHYLTRGLALYESLCRVCPQMRLWILCLDEATAEILSSLHLPKSRLIRMDEFETFDEELREAKNNRNRLEYYFTCTPVLPRFVFNDAIEVEMVTYLDADMWFFTSPQGIFDEMDNNSIAIIGHRYAPGAKFLEGSAGIYNVSWVTFRKDAEGLDCLNTWRKQCLEWCYDRADGARNADQKYLDYWPAKYKGLKVLEQAGAGAAPWNIEQYQINVRDGKVLLDGKPLYFYHFHGVNQVNRRVYDPMLSHFNARVHPALLEFIYKPYLCMLEAIQAQLLEGKVKEGALGNLRMKIYQDSARKRPTWLERIRILARAVKWVMKGVYIYIPDISKRARETDTGIISKT